MKQIFNYGRVNGWGNHEHVAVRAEKEPKFDGKRLLRISLDHGESERCGMYLDDTNARALAELLQEFTSSSGESS